MKRPTRCGRPSLIDHSRRVSPEEGRRRYLLPEPSRRGGRPPSCHRRRWKRCVRFLFCRTKLSQTRSSEATRTPDVISHLSNFFSRGIFFFRLPPAVCATNDPLVKTDLVSPVINLHKFFFALRNPPPLVVSELHRSFSKCAPAAARRAGAAARGAQRAVSPRRKKINK